MSFKQKTTFLVLFFFNVLNVYRAVPQPRISPGAAPAPPVRHCPVAPGQTSGGQGQSGEDPALLGEVPNLPLAAQQGEKTAHKLSWKVFLLITSLLLTTPGSVPWRQRGRRRALGGEPRPSVSPSVHPPPPACRRGRGERVRFAPSPGGESTLQPPGRLFPSAAPSSSSHQPRGAEGSLAGPSEQQSSPALLQRFPSPPPGGTTPSELGTGALRCSSPSHTSSTPCPRAQTDSS